MSLLACTLMAVQGSAQQPAVVEDDTIIEDAHDSKLAVPKVETPQPTTFIETTDKQGKTVLVPAEGSKTYDPNRPLQVQQPAAEPAPQEQPAAIPAPKAEQAPQPPPAQEPAAKADTRPAPKAQQKQDTGLIPEPADDSALPEPPPDTGAETTGDIPPWLQEDGTDTPATQQDEDISRLNAEAEERGGASVTATPRREKDQHVVSQSRMFSVSGGDSLRMGAIATRADEVNSRLCSLLKLPHDWKNAISIRLVGQSTDQPVRDPIRKRISIIGGAPNFQIRIYPGGGIDLEALDQAIITMVLYERALRSLPADAYPDTVALPAWLVTGIGQALLWRTGRADRRLYRSLHDRAEMIPPEEIVGIEEPEKLDAASRQIYDVSCGVLIMALINSPNGLPRLRDMIAEAAASDSSPTEFITAHFHELSADQAMLDKWWALELAALALPKASDALSPLESEKQLEDALTLVYFDTELEVARTVSIDNVYELLKVPDWENQLRPNIERLVGLSATAFPAYRKIVVEYCRVLSNLQDDHDPDAAQSSLGPLRELREAYSAAATRGQDYLDWYEITHLGHTNTRSFDTYLEAMHLLRQEKQGPDTPISRYLDDIETLRSLKAEDPLPQKIRDQIGRDPDSLK